MHKTTLIGSTGARRHEVFGPAFFKAMGYCKTAFLVLAFICMPVSIVNASDLTNLLEKKNTVAKEVVTRPTIARVSELPRLPVSLRQYEFLIDHPRLSMALARMYDPSLDAYKVAVRPDGSIHVDDPAGMAGDMELINSITGRRVYFISGHFDFLKMRFKGYMVLLMAYYERHGEGAASVDSRTTSYIKVKSAFAGFFAKVMAFLFPRKVDDRISRFANAVKRVAIAVHDDPTGAYGKLAASGEVGPGELKEFAGMFLRRA
jgi:hypothetical protein